jgi:diadenosine tetraphosphatase ApaH/serine/threonine PP2A family protein phosphatase
MRIYAIGDIHGRLDLLNQLFERIEQDLDSRPTPQALFVFLGDYVDRGPESRQTIDRLIGFAKTAKAVFLKGNHELIALKCLSDAPLFDAWMRRLGGIDTLASYGVDLRAFAGEGRIVRLQAAFHKALPQAHFRFFRNLETSFACGDFFFVHAGARPGVALSQQKESDLLWIRDEFLSSDFDFGKIIVHGHTPIPDVDVRPNRINIDTGAFATGRLTCLVIERSGLSKIETT